MSTDATLLPSALPFSKEQEKAWNLLREGKNVFITGPGGTGKTFFIQKLYAQWITENKIVAVCAFSTTRRTAFRRNSRDPVFQTVILCSFPNVFNN